MATDSASSRWSVREYSVRDAVSAARGAPTRYKLGVLGLLLLAAIPAALTPIQLTQFIPLLYLMMFAISWDVVSGYTGQISFGHTLFFGLGAYTTTILNLQHGIEPYLSIPAGVLVAMLGGLLIGVPSLRVRGPYLSLITLIAPLVLFQLIILFSGGIPFLAPGGTGGTGGFGNQNDPLVAVGGPTIDPVISMGSFRTAVIVDFYLAFLALLLILALSLLVTRSDAGDVFTAIREDEDVVAAVGINPAKHKIFAFVFSAGLGGFAAAMFVHSTSAGNPLQPGQVIEIQRALDVIIMAILGGMGTVVGAAVGAVFFVIVGAVMGAIPVTIPIINQTPGELSPIPVFAAAVLVLIFRPGGLVRWGISMGDRLRARLRGEEPESDDEDTPLERTIKNYLEEFRELR